MYLFQRKYKQIDYQNIIEISSKFIFEGKSNNQLLLILGKLYLVLILSENQQKCN